LFQRSGDRAGERADRVDLTVDVDLDGLVCGGDGHPTSRQDKRKRPQYSDQELAPLGLVSWFHGVSSQRGVLISRGIPCPPARKRLRVRLRTYLPPAGVRTYATLTPPLSNCHLFAAALCDNSPKLSEVDHTAR